MPPTENEATIDGQLELKKRARRRLVGAAALALLAAVVLPMVMDREPRQPAQEVQVRIPSQEAGGLLSRVTPKKPEATPLPPVESDSKAEAKSEPKPEAKPEPRQETKLAEKPAEKPAEKSVEKSADKPGDKAAEKPAAKPVPGKADEARARAALAGANGDGGQWIVQLGAYKEEGRVKVLLAKLKQMNLPAYTEKVDTPQGARTRVRAGPFKGREAAEQAQVRISKIGVEGPVAQK